jgi:hypothetical protein
MDEQDGKQINADNDPLHCNVLMTMAAAAAILYG